MTGLLLATLLNLSPGIVLADNVESRHVALSDVRFRLQFVSDDSEKPEPTLDQMTREQLAEELKRVESSRPSIVGPIVLLAVGAGLGASGVVLFLTGLASVGRATTVAQLIPYLMVGLGGVLSVVGVVLLIVGAIMLPIKIIKRARAGSEANDIRTRMDASDRARPIEAPPVPPPAAPMSPEAPPPPPPLPLPPPPPPPAQANLVVPGFMQTVMVF